MYGWHKPLFIFVVFGWHYNIYVPLPFNKTKICMCTYSSSLLLLRFFFAQIFRMPRMTLNGNLRNYLSCSMSFEFTLHRFPLLFSILHFSSLINVQIICKNKTLLRPIIKLWLMCNFNYYINHHNCNTNATNSRFLFPMVCVVWHFFVPCVHVVRLCTKLLFFCNFFCAFVCSFLQCVWGENEPTKDNNWMHSSRNYLACVYKWKP